MGRYVEAEGWLASRTGYGRRSYRAYVPHKLEGWIPTLDADSVNAITAAERALSAAAEGAHTTLGDSLMDWMMARDESIRSSVIEGVTATVSGLEWARYADQAGRPVSDDNDALTLGAVKQLAAAVELGHRIRTGYSATLDDVSEIHNRLFEGTPDRAIGGLLRTEPIWIGSPGSLVDDASFVPPPAEHVSELMHDLVEYLNTSDHPTALRAVVVHSQFETIHPFDDGNGRTGRALIHTVLIAAGLTDSAVPISAALSRDRRAYYDALNATRSVCEPDNSAARSTALRIWLDVFSYSCEEAHRQATALRTTVERMVDRWQATAKFRRGSAAAALLEALPSMPVLDAPMVAERLGVSTRVARTALSSLEAAGILTPVGGRRNRRFFSPDLVGVLRQVTPDRGRAYPSISEFDSTASAHSRLPIANPSLTQCSHRGPRSRERCRLPQGHRGQHRYS
ncbi:MAG: Fic family protein [Acidimicrobiaceae bacterium]|nr:Fic family protein [Acidimicrobiaceae bacterium]